MGIGFWPQGSVLWTRKRALRAESGEATDALSRDSQSRRNPYNPISFATVVFWGSETNFFSSQGLMQPKLVLDLQDSQG